MTSNEGRGPDRKNFLRSDIDLEADRELNAATLRLVQAIHNAAVVSGNKAGQGWDYKRELAERITRDVCNYVGFAAPASVYPQTIEQEFTES